MFWCIFRKYAQQRIQEQGNVAHFRPHVKALECSEDGSINGKKLLWENARVQRLNWRPFSLVVSGVMATSPPYLRGSSSFLTSGVALENASL
jgi:hypothetical protein